MTTIRVNAEVVRMYKYLVLLLDDKLDWSANRTSTRKISQFNICKNILQMFYQSVVAMLYCAGGGNLKSRTPHDWTRLLEELNLSLALSWKGGLWTKCCPSCGTPVTLGREDFPSGRACSVADIHHRGALPTDSGNPLFPEPYSVLILLYNAWGCD